MFPMSLESGRVDRADGKSQDNKLKIVQISRKIFTG